MKNKTIFIGFIIGVGILLLAVIGNYFSKDNMTKDEGIFSNVVQDNIIQSNINILEVSDVPEDCDVVFTHRFTDITKINAIQPIGSITGASPGRSYLDIKEGETVPVYAPMDATLKFIAYSYRGPEAPYPEYGFSFDTGCGVTFMLDHLDTISDELKQYAPIEPSLATDGTNNLSVEVEAGTLLGYTDGTEQAKTFDFLVIDKNTDVFHINPERWDWDQALHAVCPYDLYTDDLKSEYYEKIGTYYYTGFVKAESCGNPSYDIVGTISGGWFLGENDTMMTGEFMTIGEEGGNVYTIVKNNLEDVIIRVDDYWTEVMPKDVKVGSSACYFDNNTDTWMFLNLVSEETIQLANGNGNCPVEFPDSNIKIYSR
ncbi:MAG: hypothetical protein ACNFW9_05755 [Candidatus Kerfeldbacteria bacterium]